MKKFSKEDLLKDKRVIAEIERHLWIESEKAGRDIGFDQAATEWLEKFSKDWMRYYMPEDVSAIGKKKGKTTRAKRK